MESICSSYGKISSFRKKRWHPCDWNFHLNVTCKNDPWPTPLRIQFLCCRTEYKKCLYKPLPSLKGILSCTIVKIKIIRVFSISTIDKKLKLTFKYTLKLVYNAVTGVWGTHNFSKTTFWTKFETSDGHKIEKNRKFQNFLHNVFVSPWYLPL